MQSTIVNMAYLLAAVLFILGLKGLAHPRTAVRGNLLGALGMFIAVVVTLFHRRIVSFEIILAGFVVGAAVGAILAAKIQMTAMPQLVALFNGFGGGASVLVAGGAFIEAMSIGSIASRQFTIATAASGIIGAVTFWGSLVAFSKLQGIIRKKNTYFAGQQILNIVLGLVAIALGVWIVLNPTIMVPYWALVGVASALGISLVIPIGGADMPVVIALLNSYSGLAACATGFVLSNNILVISGSLVGASGIILTKIMCKAMNRSIANVLFGKVGTSAESTVDVDEMYEGRVKSASAEEVVMLLDSAHRVVIVPGYGMAVSQAQYAVRDLVNLLESKGAEVEFGIHPVAGRMPGHMNVLLAEADIPYDRLKEMEQINPSFEQTDVALVIGANDVVNPLARDDTSTPIYGMPIMDVDKARTVVIIKRSLSPGFSGVPNPLFANDNTLMLFGDGKEAVLSLITELKDL
ncbi:NAD(P)(+) transhydrogenase (Re/Si-specific) subunit beta [Candidatus Poribacteria bacterium]